MNLYNIDDVIPKPFPDLTTEEMFAMHDWLKAHRPDRYRGYAQKPVRIHVQTTSDDCPYDRLVNICVPRRRKPLFRALTDMIFRVMP